MKLKYFLIVILLANNFLYSQAYIDKNNPEFEEFQKEFQKASYLLENNKIDESKALFYKLLTKFPNDFLLNNSLAMIYYFDEQKYDSANFHFDKCLEYDKEISGLLYYEFICFSNLFENNIEKVVDIITPLMNNKNGLIPYSYDIYNVVCLWEYNKKFEKLDPNYLNGKLRDEYTVTNASQIWLIDKMINYLNYTYIDEKYDYENNILKKRYEKRDDSKSVKTVNFNINWKVRNDFCDTNPNKIGDFSIQNIDNQEMNDLQKAGFTLARDLDADLEMQDVIEMR